VGGYGSGVESRIIFCGEIWIRNVTERGPSEDIYVFTVVSLVREGERLRWRCTDLHPYYLHEAELCLTYETPQSSKGREPMPCGK
jgi:hypothetical protein